MCLPALCGGSPAREEASTGTLLFVDVDGVLNVSIEDPGKKAVSFNPANVQRAIKAKGACNDLPADDLVEKIFSTYHRQEGHERDSTYAEYVSSAQLNACEEMVSRLARLIQAAGDRCTVVLTSSWRGPRHAGQVRRLEAALRECLGGEQFRFHDQTALVPDNRPDQRLRTIGDFIKTRCPQIFRSSHSPRKWRVLVLEDFHVSALDGWLCDGISVDSTTAAENYLLSKMPTFINVSVKLVHTFGSWTTPSGLTVRIGTGLTTEHFSAAMEFLGGSARPH